VILPVAFLVVLGITALNLGGWNVALMWLILTLIPTIGLVIGAYAMPVLLGRVIVNRSGMGFFVDGMLAPGSPAQVILRMVRDEGSMPIFRAVSAMPST